LILVIKVYLFINGYCVYENRTDTRDAYLHIH